MSEFNTALRDGNVRFGYDFNNVAEVTHLWGATAKRLPHGIGFRIPDADDTIALLLGENGGRGWKNIPRRSLKMDDRGHRQIVRIDEVNVDKKVSEERCRQELEKPLTRYVFWREKLNGVQWYKFHGAFRIDAEATKASLDAGDNVCVYAKTADTCPCLKADWHLAEISAAEFAGYAGRVVEAVLKDEIDCRIGEERSDGGSVRIYPGQKLFVRELSPGGDRAVCLTKDENVLAGAVRKEEDYGLPVEFTIPRRDFELGYFRVRPGMRKLRDTTSEVPVEVSETVDVSGELGGFWRELKAWWNDRGVSIEGEELVQLTCERVSYSLMCAWNRDFLLLSVAKPWPKEWDYVELYRGMFRVGETETDFRDGDLRKKVLKLLLAKIARRIRWKKENPRELPDRNRLIAEEMSGASGEAPEGLPAWFAEYRWTRDMVEDEEEGDMRLYVVGDDHIWGDPLFCRWTLDDMYAEEMARKAEQDKIRNMRVSSPRFPMSATETARRDA